MIILIDFDLTLTKVSVTKQHQSASPSQIFKSYVECCFRNFVQRMNRAGNVVVILSFNHFSAIEKALEKIGVSPKEVVIATPELLEGKNGAEAHREANSGSPNPLVNMKVRFIDRLARQGGLSKSKFIFFDDNAQNIRAMSSYGVKSVRVPTMESGMDPIRSLLMSTA